MLMRDVRDKVRDAYLDSKKLANARVLLLILHTLSALLLHAKVGGARHTPDATCQILAFARRQLAVRTVHFYHILHDYG